MISITIAGVIESILCSCGNKQKQIAVDERWNFTDWIRNDPYFFFFQIYICPLKNPCFFSSLKSIFYWNNKWCQYLYWNVCILVNPLMLINPGFQPDEWGTNRIIIFLWSISNTYTGIVLPCFNWAEANLIEGNWFIRASICRKCAFFYMFVCSKVFFLFLVDL